MRLIHHQTPSTLVVLLLTTLAGAHPYPQDDLRDAGFGYLMNRDCALYCGADNQYCCSSGQTCVTSANIASCAGGGGGYAFSTTTWTETKTYTSTYSTYLPGATTPASGGSGGEPCVPPAGSGQIACGPICCANWQYCSDNVKGQCMPNEGAGTWSYGTTVGVVTTQYSAPYRVTSGSTIFATTTGTAASQTSGPSATGTAEPVTTTNNQLSGGAIAGIVVGTIAGVILLLLLCFCCIVRGAWHALLGIFGIGNKKKKSTERIEIEERYSRHGSRPTSVRPAHRTWFGGGGGRPSTVTSRREKEEKSSGAGWLATAGLAAAALLGLRRDNKKKANSKPPRSDWSSSYYTDSYSASSPSSFSDDRRTRRSRHSRHSRGTGYSRHSRHTRRS